MKQPSLDQLIQITRTLAHDDDFAAGNALYLGLSWLE